MATKYYKGVEEAQRNQKPVDELPPFDPERMRSSGFAARLVSRFLENPRWFFSILRKVRPNVKLGPFVFVSRNADVREVLERQDVFETPFGLEMEEMAGGSNFILGMRDSKQYRQMKSAVLSAFPVDEIESRVRPIAADHSRRIMLRACSGFDVVDKLLKIVPVKICREYYGLLIDDEVGFADRALALSAFFFGDPMGDPAARELAVVAARDMTKVLDRSVEAVRNGSSDTDTPLGRLVAMADRKRDPLPMDDLRSIMMGMVTGFMPTNLLAAGNCLDVVLSNRDAQNTVEEAIAAKDNKLLEKAIVEAMRFKPINMGPFRYARKTATIAEGTKRQYTIEEGSSIWPLTWSAMFDPEAVDNPGKYDILRPDTDYMVFGHGIHWCIGAALAKVQISEAFRVIFSKQNVRRASGRAGKLKRRGPYPESLAVAFDMPANCRTTAHTMATMCFPVREDVDLVALRKQIAALGNPAAGSVSESFDEARIVHFASMALVGENEKAGPSDRHPAHVVIEFSADGDRRTAIRSLAISGEAHFRPIFTQACGLKTDEMLEDFLNRHVVTFGPFPWQNAGLAFAGTPGHSIARIREEADLQLTVERMLRDRDDTWPRHAAGILERVRSELASTPGFDWAFQPADSNLETREGSWGKAVLAVATRTAAGSLLLVLWLIVTLFTYAYVLKGATSWLTAVPTFLAAAVIAFLMLAAVAGGIGWGLITLLRRKENKDPFSDEMLDEARYTAIVERENYSQQNHLTGISVMKGGIFRRAALRLVFYVIGVAATHVFRPGTLSDINTIHFARWALLPGTNKLLFFSNYGGSWESYLEDFITKARQGLTGVWSNTIGFPPTKNLFDNGAKNGDLFKRWARMQQAPTLFWYQAYPGIKTRRFRTNSAIRQGIARIETDNEAREWLTYFGSLPRPDYVLETSEIQSLVFGAMAALEKAEMIGISVPEGITSSKRKTWLSWLEKNLSFGDRKPKGSAMIAAIGPKGLERLGLGDLANGSGVNSFPMAFRQGMDDTARARILDDEGDNAPEKWDWGNSAREADLVILCYAENATGLSRMKAQVTRECAKAGMEITVKIPLAIQKMSNGLSREHFQFADGISQPRLKGTSRALGSVPQQHVVEAGEFILGYRDQRNNFPLSPFVPAYADHHNLLAGVASQDNREEPLPDHRNLRDFGRNGTFLVVRQLEQHVSAFNKFCREAAKKINSSGRLDVEIDKEWVGAKLVGRWKDGSSLVRNPYGKSGEPIDNDFTFGAEDPQGLRCPLGSHIRRSNPRDSLGPDREEQTELGKRHRIMRVGRTYEYPNGKGKTGQKGLLFMCLNADIERQFEFVQQTWVGASAFHGLRTERDPLIGNPRKNDRYTIPTERGGITVDGLQRFTTMRGGGYFFMPGRSALKFLISQL